MNADILKKAQEWTGADYDDATRKEIQSLLDSGDEKELTDRFWQDLEFGTGGLRGIRGAGTSRMNIYNIRKATQGLANYIIAQGGQKQGVVIGRDSRHFSLEFAREAASVLAANGITVYFFQDICPTPITSFTVLKTGAKAGIMNTASHNPKEYNGYKVYWEDGAQLSPPHDQNVMDEITKVSKQSMIKTMSFETCEKSPLFSYCDQYFEIYLQEASALPKDKDLIGSSNIKILYSPLYGAGYKCAPTLLKQAGFKNVEVFKLQAVPNGDFPSAPYPNPEEVKTMQIGMDYAQSQNFDIFIANDPDADRIGVAYKKIDGSYALLNGNQIGILIANYLALYPKPAKPFLVSTIVTSPLLGLIAQKNGVEYSEVLTGFRWIACKIKELEQQGKTLFFGLEESHGYNFFDKVRDKDGLTASMIISEAAAYYKKAGKTLDTVLFEIYKTYGYYKETQVNFSFPGIEGVEMIKTMMENLRKNPPQKIQGLKVLECRDYQNNTILKDGKQLPGLGLPISNVFALHLEEGARIIARPSGTEPKIKFYFSTLTEVHCENCFKTADKEHQELSEAFLKIIK